MAPPVALGVHLGILAWESVKRATPLYFCVLNVCRRDTLGYCAQHKVRVRVSAKISYGRRTGSERRNAKHLGTGSSHSRISLLSQSPLSASISCKKLEVLVKPKLSNHKAATLFAAPPGVWGHWHQTAP
jgi:hypothetical protein